MKHRGTSLIDLLISMAIVAVLFGGIYLVYFSLVTAITNIGVRTAAASAVQAEIETIRNLPYASVGTVNGIPPGIIPQSQTVSEGSYSFTLTTTMRNIDDPFDGSVTGTVPVDTAPADYKLVEIEATCPLCNNFTSVSVTTTVAPKNLESATQNGSLFVYALDANGNPVADATVQVTNALVAPSINLIDTTNASGVLQLVGVPTSTQGYQITVTKPGYSTDKTYPYGAPANPNPVKPHATVAAQTVTAITFSIDALSSFTVSASNNRCVPIGGESFSVQGTKLVGTNPDVLKFSTTSFTSATGSFAFPAIEWDTYALLPNDVARDIVGTIPLGPFIIDPSSTAGFRFVMQPAADPSLLVTAVNNASITLTKTGFSQTLTAGHAFVTQDDWSAGQYAAQSGGLNTGPPERITLLVNASGTYNTGTNEWLISNTFDLGGSSSTFYSVSWDPVSQPPGTTIGFQIAANNDNAMWNFIGPDGTPGTTFTNAPASLPASLAGNRYFRYKVFLNTADENVAPEINDVTVEFSANCVPPAQALFTNLPQGTYLVDATAENYAEATTAVSVGPGTQAVQIPLTRL